jgi:hypothetical protein
LLPIFFYIYIYDLFLTELVTKVEPNINSIEVHPQPSNNRYPVDGALVGTGSVWASTPTSVEAPYAYLMLSSVKAPYTLFMPPSVGVPYAYYYVQKGLSNKVESKLIIKI